MKVNAVHYTEIEDCQPPIERHIKVKNEDAKRKAHGWTESVNIDLKFNANC